MKIAFYSILNLAYGGGFEKWVEQVATILSTRGHQIIILTTKYGDNNNKIIQKICTGMELEFLSMKIIKDYL